MNSQKLLSVSNLSVQYESLLAITNVSLNVFADDYIGIIGPNGGGKTSLIKAMLGLVPYKGKIEFSKELKNRCKIGYLPQKHNFDISFPITVGEVIRSGLQGEENNIGRHAISIRVQELMKLTGIYTLNTKSISHISGGEMQRALLCRALISNPKLLILDEPATYVDSKFEQDLYCILNELNKRMAIIMVSHDVGTISSHVKSIICVNQTVHRHDINELTSEMLQNYGCPIQVITHGDIPHTVLGRH